ncbi:hypothetical protein KSB_95220 [Ktedonobacter robiniae]|uniref:Uncharacterized protein n=2 Tax=Ktedonobacter robiniae TaxID=2778365 RepID=A0ABQ3V944_9CHLR|nr:hypothetical protein KSB_95220 [Ktedonobacter robiniae]
MFLHVPEGDVIDVPFDSEYKTDSLFYNEQIPELRFDVSLWLQVDEDERSAFRENEWGDELFVVDEQGYVTFGYLYLTIDFRREKPGSPVSFRFVSATDDMSDLMAYSHSLRRLFSTLLVDGGGICGFLDFEGTRDESLLWWLKGQNMERWIPVPGEGEVSESDMWFCRRYDGLVVE